MSKRAVAVALASGAFASLGAAGQALAAGHLELLRSGEPAPVGTHVVARVGFTDAEAPGLGSCVQIATGTLQSNGRGADRAELTELAQSQCFEGPGFSVAGFPTRMVYRSSGIASAIAPGAFTITEPGPCTYTVKRVFGSFDPFAGGTEFGFTVLAKLTKGTSFTCTVGRQIVGAAVLKAHLGEDDETEPLELQTTIEA